MCFHLIYIATINLECQIKVKNCNVLSFKHIIVPYDILKSFESTIIEMGLTFIKTFLQKKWKTVNLSHYSII